MVNPGSPLSNELLAAFLALKSFMGKKMGLAVLLKMDITALTINKMWGPDLHLLSSLMMEMWSLCL